MHNSSILFGSRNIGSKLLTSRAICSSGRKLWWVADFKPTSVFRGFSDSYTRKGFEPGRLAFGENSEPLGLEEKPMVRCAIKI